MSSLSRIHEFSQDTINVPTLLATAFSVGLHGLIWIVGPNISSSSEASSQGQRTVGVVQLTPSEMSRLPEYSLARSSLPNIPVSPPPTNILPPLSSARVYPPVLPPIPTSPTYTYIPPVIDSPSSSNVKGRSQVTVPATPQLPSQEGQPKPASESSKAESIGNESGKPLQSESSLSPKAQLGSDGLKESIESYLAEQDSRNPKTNPSTSNQEGNQPTQQSSGRENGEKPTRSTNQTSSGRLPLGVREGMLPDTAFVPGSRETTSTTEKENNTLSPENLQAHLPHFYPKPSDSRTAPENNSSSGSRSLTENQKNALASGTLSTWLEDRRRQFSQDVKLTPMPDPVFVKSPLKVKVPNITFASVIVLVNPEGKRIGDGELIRSTGDLRLDKAAMDNIHQRSSLPPTGKYEAYLYRIEIDQDGLPALATTESPKR